MSYNKLLPLMKRKGCVLTPKQFQERVNVVFHDHESAIYDEAHSDLKNNLQEQIDLLISDLFKNEHFVPKQLKLTDIGCGTGLSTEYLLNSELQPLVEHITLLDSSEEMLKQARKKAVTWTKPPNFVKGYLKDVEGKFDFVIICSVLHHIPDLEEFLRQVEGIMNPGGILLHLQDPNADYLNDDIYRERLALMETRQNLNLQKKKSLKDLIPKSLRRTINRTRGRKDYIDLINEQLLKEKVITKRMTADELWSVTDVHVPSKFDTSSKGISVEFLKDQLKNFELISQRSYGFYGRLKSDLDEELQKEEERLILDNQLNGRNLSCIWIKNS